MGVTYLPSQSRKKQDVPLPYTASPWKLLWADILLFIRSLWSLPGIILPLTPWNSGALDELYPSKENLWDIVVHIFLAVYQLIFLLSLPILFILAFPALGIGIYMTVALTLNWVFCRFALNGSARILQSQVPVEHRPEHDREHWVFINGVGAGHHWLQSNLDRLAYTFGRNITGVHNPTTGIVFDIIECLIQRNFSYATSDVRDAYAIIKEDLLNPKYKKVILILHSQGGIEGGLVIDWLLDEMPRELLQDLEVYTFGNAANHFNNPFKSLSQAHRNEAEGETPQVSPAAIGTKTIRRIEHYANSKDFVSVWGILNFANIPNRYMGRVFVRPGSGHQFIQHHLDTMFTLGKDMKTLDTNDFMEMEVKVQPDELNRLKADGRDTGDRVGHHDIDFPCDEMNANVSLLQSDGSFRRKMKVKELSRLWLYRNGASPIDGS
ncbi:hypothetical protein CNMCM8980_007468 [Aspergillus fumigatiaffinis]|uniref:Uncharacterized protein n=1 Tax=Aspergillus fumigatiaffinis TaxID=340414 RepID=A0A8H4M9R2_9EURO|nr:hypothetical protein CNMCM5878_007369 [Aspergillus fumigatiaffinis]KAF4234790.1 hypothetical protein CNMCM6457_003741 [Aspergillus fumigatiaffinis]KAF4235929.1 hypothetical protein CNMCM6805_007717 [Aspergillus fumigatiaffinis]KAF4247289.1 hypothetical protein CNMCM8980_007468 [Aspergillus fumigatiaffinis]